MCLDDLNALPDDEAAEALLRCCGSTRWAHMMAAARPFTSADALVDAAETAGTSLDREDWLEAFGAHPQIGERTQSLWAAAEQAGSRSASDELSRRLAEGNTAYRARFGYIFIVCAAGKSAGEMLGLLECRLTNDARTEWRVAAGEQRKITRLRLAKLLR